MFVSVMGQLEFISENLLSDYADVFPANHSSQDFQQGTFTPATITRKHKDRLAVVDAFEYLAEIPLQQANVSRLQDMRQERAQENLALGLWIIFQRQDLFHWAAGI